MTLHSRLAVGRLSKPRRPRGRIRFRLRPVWDEVEVVRARPPAARWRDPSADRLPVPAPLHAKASQWRVHLAGYRGEPPGVAARVLCDAGRTMGYHIGCIHDPTPIGAGRRGWAQVLFTRPRDDQSPFAVSPHHQFPDQQPSHDRLTGARIISQDEAQRLSG